MVASSKLPKKAEGRPGPYDRKASFASSGAESATSVSGKPGQVDRRGSFACSETGSAYRMYTESPGSY